MARDFDGSTSYLNHADGSDVPITPYTFSESVWVNLDASGRQDFICGFAYNPGDMPGNIEFGDSTVGAGFPVDNKIFGGIFVAGWYYAPDPNDFVLSSWRHVLLTFNGTTQSLYIQGSLAYSANPGITPNPAAGQDLIVGQRNGNYGDGRIAEFAYWKTALGAGEAAALAKGANPLSIRPGHLRLYVPIWGVATPEIDLVGLHPMTVNGTTPLANHAPVGPPPGAFA